MESGKTLWLLLFVVVTLGMEWNECFFEGEVLIVEACALMSQMVVS